MAVSDALPISSTLSIGADFSRRYRSLFVVESDIRSEAPNTVIDANGIPTFRQDSYAWPPPPQTPTNTDQWAFAVEARAFNPDPRASTKVWNVEVIHETIRRAANRRPIATPVEDPLLEPPIYGGSFFTFQEETRVDANFNLLKFSNGLPMRGIQKEYHQDQLTIELNTATISLTQRNQAIGRINQAAFWGFPLETIRLTGWEYNINYYGSSDTPFVQHFFSFQFDQLNSWRTKVEHRHTIQRTNGSPTNGLPWEKYETIQIQHGDPFVDPPDEVYKVDVTEPMPLNAQGRWEDDEANVHTTDEQLEQTFDFTTLPIPQTLPNPPFAP